MTDFDLAGALEPAIRSLQDGVVIVDLEGRHLYVNPAFERMTGISADDLVGHGLPAPYWPPEHLNEIVRAFEETSKAQPGSYQLVFRRQNGERFPVTVRPSRVQTADGELLVAIVRDRTEDERRRGQLRQVTEMLSIMLSAGDLAWWRWNVAAGTAEVSDSYFTMLGYAPGAWPVGYEEWAARVHPDDIGGADEAMSALLEDRSKLYDVEHRMLDASGQWKWILARGYVLQRSADGSPEVVGGTHQDIVRLKSQEERVRQFYQMELVGQMASGVAHDFNNLLTVLSMGLDGFRVEDPEDVRARIADMEEALSRARSLTRSMLAYARADDDEPADIEVGSVLREVGPLVERTLSGSTRAEWDIADEVHPVRVDRHRFESSVLNLVVNADAALSAAGGGTVRIATETRSLRTKEVTGQGLAPGSYVRVRVEDDGPGMPPEVERRVFEPLYTTKPPGTGSGLGLPMVHRFATDVGGGVFVETAEGKGTRVDLWIPLTSARATVETAFPELGGEGLGGSERILIVDDEPPVLRVMTRALDTLGYHVDAVDNPRAALQLLSENDYDLLITDIVMPYTLDGVDLAQRSRTLHPDLPILFVSGYMDRARAADVVDLGPVVKKPFRLEEFATRIRQVFDAPVGG